MAKVGVIGVGSMGQNHARIYSEIADLVGVYDVDQAQSKRVADRFGVDSFASIDLLLQRVDAVSVSTITTTHLEVATKVIKAGRHLLLEKPFTGSSKTAKELCALAEKEGVILGAGFVERHNPVVGVARSALAEGRFGKPISFASRRVSSFPARIRDVGVLMDLGIHDVDVLRYLTGDEAVSVFALGGHFNNKQFEDHASVLIETKGGLEAYLEVNWLTPMKVRKVSLTCSAGFVQLDYIDQSLEFSSSVTKEFDAADAFRVPLEQDVRRVCVRKEEPLKIELQDFLKAVGSGGRPLANGEDAYADLRICEAALKSLHERKKVEV
ncbi:MAG TPA: Gfo/Idh/MocA family oxidoreductase [Methanomassiliicoccales archaeon]|nr:Gfo/Idh/MocA family oxidoreductase [Methanomassiliicoccales archaeon]